MVAVDLHCHIDLFPDPVRVAAECASRGIYVLSVTTVPSAFRGTAALAPPGSKIRTALGMHPELVVSRRHEFSQFESLIQETSYIGEIGLDGSRAHRGQLNEQETVFREVLRLCRVSGGRVLSIHSRGASGAVLDVIEREPSSGRFVLHWYLGSNRQIARAADMGCWFSVGPAMLASARGLSAVAAMPRNRVLPESDGPFGVHNGRVVYPWDAHAVVPTLAEVWGESVVEVEERIEQAFRQLVAPGVGTRGSEV